METAEAEDVIDEAVENMVVIPTTTGGTLTTNSSPLTDLTKLLAELDILRAQATDIQARFNRHDRTMPRVWRTVQHPLPSTTACIDAIDVGVDVVHIADYERMPTVDPLAAVHVGIGIATAIQDGHMRMVNGIVDANDDDNLERCSDVGCYDAIDTADATVGVVTTLEEDGFSSIPTEDCYAVDDVGYNSDNECEPHVVVLAAIDGNGVVNLEPDRFIPTVLDSVTAVDADTTLVSTSDVNVGIGVDKLEDDRCIPTVLNCINAFDVGIGNVTLVRKRDVDVGIGVDSLEEDRCIPTKSDSCAVDIGSGVVNLEEYRYISTATNISFDDATLLGNCDVDVDIDVGTPKEDRCISKATDILEEDRCISTVMDFGNAVNANAVDIGISVAPVVKSSGVDVSMSSRPFPRRTDPFPLTTLTTPFAELDILRAQAKNIFQHPLPSSSACINAVDVHRSVAPLEDDDCTPTVDVINVIDIGTGAATLEEDACEPTMEFIDTINIDVGVIDAIGFDGGIVHHLQENDFITTSVGSMIITDDDDMDCEPTHSSCDVTCGTYLDGDDDNDVDIGLLISSTDGDPTLGCPLEEDGCTPNTDGSTTTDSEMVLMLSLPLWIMVPLLSCLPWILY